MYLKISQIGEEIPKYIRSLKIKITNIEYLRSLFFRKYLLCSDFYVKVEK